jgi:hypothetical protein
MTRISRHENRHRQARKAKKPVATYEAATAATNEAKPGATHAAPFDALSEASSAAAETQKKKT